MEAGWGGAFVEHFARFEDGIATVLTRDNREFFAKNAEEVKVLETFPTAWIIQGRYVIPESEIMRVEISGEEPEDEE